MSWWDASSIGGFASQALKNAQKKIDKALDIKEDDTSVAQTPLETSTKSSKKDEESDFFSSWGLNTSGFLSQSPAQKDDSQSMPTTPSSAFSSVPKSSSTGKLKVKKIRKGSTDNLSEHEFKTEKIDWGFKKEQNEDENLSQLTNDENVTSIETNEINVENVSGNVESKSTSFEQTSDNVNINDDSCSAVLNLEDEDETVDSREDTGLMSSVLEKDTLTDSLDTKSPSVIEAQDADYGLQGKESGWNDLSLSLLTESQSMSLSMRSVDNDDKEKEAPIIDNEEQSSILVEKTSDVDHDDKQKDNTPNQDSSKVSEDVSEHSALSDNDEVKKDDNEKLTQLTPVQPEISSDSLHGTNDDVMEESHESGELSDSNQTVIGDDVGSVKASSDIDDCDDENVSDESPSQQEIAMAGGNLDPSPNEKMAHKSEMNQSGYVKNMLEEAMVESVKDSDSHAGSSQSSVDMVRIESGHNSADEIETTTSSDIEIISHISTPTPNGEQRMDRPFDLSPLRHAFSKSVSRRLSPPGHRRNDSGSSIVSYQSGNGSEMVSPPGMIRHPEPPADDVQGSLGLSGSAGDDSRNNPYETDKLLKESCKLQTIDEHSNDPQELLKKLADTAEILDAREKKLISLSQENMSLVENNNILKSLLKESEEARESDQTDLHALTDEFTKRIAEAEKRINQSNKDKDMFKKRCSDLETELLKQSGTSSATERLIREKDEQISELTLEGEKLSKQQLQSNNIIKKLRAKEKENDLTIKSQKDKLESQKAEIERLQKILDNKCDIEQKQIDAINQLNNMVKKQEKELERLKGELEDSQERVRSSQQALDNSYKEIAELHKQAAAVASEQTQAALSAEMQAKQMLQVQLEQVQMQMRQEEEALITQIEDLRLSLSRQEKEYGRREDMLRQEISDLHQRLQEAEGRNQELTESVSAATRPLLRQIENLQSTYSAQSDSYEKVERNLTERYADAQNQLAMAIEKERAASEQLMNNTARLAALESQVALLRQEKSRLSAQLEVERARADMQEDQRNNETAQLEAQKLSLDKDLQEVRKEKTLLENQLEMERMKVEAEHKKLAIAHEQLRDKELQLSQVRHSSSSSPAPSHPAAVPDDMLSSFHSMTGSMNASLNASSQEEALEKALMMAASTPNGSNRLNLYESLRHTGAATLMENLQSQLKMREGEIIQLQGEIQELERTRESMARELVNLSNKNEELEDKLKEYPTFQAEHKDLDKRYQALLQMYGEKVEEADELRLDLQDVKDMYKAQIEELLKSGY